jgi:methyl-accepting chemotaxis protein
MFVKKLNLCDTIAAHYLSIIFTKGQYLKNLKIKHRIALLTFVALASFAISLFISHKTTSSNAERLISLQSQLYPALNLAIVNDGLLIQVEQIIQSAVTTGEEDNLAVVSKMVTQIKDNLSEINNLLPAESNANQRLSREITTYHNNAKRLVSAFLAENVDFNAIKSQASSNAERYEQLVKDFQQQRFNFETQFEESIENTLSDASQSEVLMLSVGIAATIIMIFMGLLVNRSIITTIKSVTSSLENISQGEGDLRSRISYDGKDEIADLVYWFNQFVSKLQSSIADTKQTTDSLSAVSTTLLTGSKNSEQTVKEQNGAIEQISQAMGEMFTSVTLIAEYASNAASEADNANTEAEQGKLVVNDAVNTIKKLAQEVQSTSAVVNKLDAFTSNVNDILDTIKGIADQTNLLALNAAIEAARAGEQGRGFAVVADEVRTLALRTQTSTQEIQQVLQELRGTSKEAVDAMQRGVETANEGVNTATLAGGALESIANKVNAISIVNEQIAAATEEQHNTSVLIQQYVADIESNALKVKSTTEDMGGISYDILNVSKQLQVITNQFKV